MEQKTRTSLKADLQQMFEKIDQFIAGEIDYKELRPYSGQFGIFQQRDKKFMVRLRVTGNRLNCKKLAFIRTELIEKFNIDFCRLSTRQDVQLHGVDPKNIREIIGICNANNFKFNGGGGDTVRNILVSEKSGVTEQSVFDVQPFVEKLWEIIGAWENAFHMPRKFKIGIFDGDNDANLAKIQDLGLIAKVQNGEYGFQVFAAGGLGNKSFEGIELFDFLPTNGVVCLVKSMLNLFNDHGDREKRGRARLRFVKERLGDDEFKRLCFEYFANCDEYRDIEILDKYENYIANSPANCVNEIDLPEDNEFRRWLHTAVTEAVSSKGFKSVKLYVKNGNLTVKQLQKLENLAEKYSFRDGELNISYSQDIILPLVDENSLVKLYNDIKKIEKTVDFKFNSFLGHVHCCVGAKVCSVGILNTEQLADKIANALDKYFAELLESGDEESCEKMLEISNNILISGCPNNCARHATAKIGMSGCRKRFAEEVVDAYKVSTKVAQDSVLTENELGVFTIDDTAEKVLQFIVQD